MNRINQIIIFLFLLSSIYSHSQKKYLDFIVNKKNDTIYGTFKEGINGKILYEKNSNLKKGGIKYYSHNLKNLKSLNLNDVLYIYEKPNNEDGIYSKTIKKSNDTTKYVLKRIKDFLHTEIRLKDYVLTNTNDTIYGEIKNPFFGKSYLLENKNTIKIEKETIEEYRYLNNVYRYLEKNKVDIFDNRNAYLKLIFNGNIKLYEYEKLVANTNQNNSLITNEVKIYYFISKSNVLYLLREINYKKTLSEIFADNPILISKINEGEYTLENIYLIVKFYNDEK
jgi:hypothetical protein